MWRGFWYRWRHDRWWVWNPTEKRQSMYGVVNRNFCGRVKYLLTGN